MNFVGLILTAFLFASLNNGYAALLGDKECTFGPAYWCGSLKNAKQCSATKHCIQTVWEKQVLPEDNDDVCKICKDMVQEARDQLLSNETQEDIRLVFEGSCRLIPIAIIQDECIKVSDEFIPELVETLASQMNPQIVCATAGLCNSPKIDRLLAQYGNQIEIPKKEEPKTIESPEQDCKDCKNFVSDLVKEARTLSRDEVLDHLLSVCGRLGSISDGCMSLVQSNFNFIYDFLTKELHPDEVCDIIGLCSRMYGDTRVALPRTGDEPCDFCVTIVSNWRNSLVANTTKEEFKKILDGICGHTGSFESECHSVVDQYFEFMYELLVSEVDPKGICELAGLCGVNALFKAKVPVWTVISMKSQDRLPLVNLKPSIDFDDFTGMDESNSIKYNDFAGQDEANAMNYDKDDFTGMDETKAIKYEAKLPRVTLKKSKINIVSLGAKGVLTEKRPEYKVTKSNECIMCEFVLHYLQTVLQEKNTREELKEAMDNVCKLFPQSVAEQCQDYVDAYGDQVIQMLILEIDPSGICPMIHMCPGVNLQDSLDTDTNCILCQYVMTELDDILKDKKNQAEVKTALESVCSIMPKTINSECVTFIDTYFDQIIDLIVHGVTPRQICAQLGLCPDNQKSFPIDPQTAQLPVSRLFIPNVFSVAEPKKSEPHYSAGQSVPCIICEFIISKLDHMIIDNSTVKEIEYVLDRICLILPSTLKNDCLGFMEDYAKSLLELLVSDIQPEYICRMLHVCSDSMTEGMLKAQVALPVDKCQVCEEVIQWIDEQTKEGQIVDIVDLVLDKVCDFLPKPSKTECYKMVTNYGQFLVSLLEELSDPKRVCQVIQMCPNHTQKTLLGAKKCTWGPSYWCQSQMHAKSCQATKHCNDKVWIDSIPAF